MVLISDITKQFKEIKYCSRCGRNCSKNPKEDNGKTYGSVCVKKIIKVKSTTKIDEDDIW